ncbi:hypothetical protein ACIPIC_02850 [Streptomyces collinus]|uniref:hypothetical protein n=1 Tax=Streptomyces collinus TaxID=42684 RepID=UPI0038287102
MNAEQWNALYPVGTPVFAYPGFRPEDDRNARRLVTRTRTEAQLSASGDPVVWVDGEGSYICLTHVDAVSESVWQAAKDSEVCGAREPEPRTGTSPCVLPAGHGGLKHQDKWTNQWPALPVPVGDQPQPLDDEVDADAVAARAAQVISNMGGEIRELTHQRDRYRLAWQSASFRAEARGEGILRVVKDRESYQQWLKQAEARVAELEAERHTTNEALTDAAETLRANRDRIAELEAQQPTLCGRTRDISGTEYPPCELRADHWQAYCRGNGGRSYFLSIASNQPTAPTEETAS